MKKSTKWKYIIKKVYRKIFVAKQEEREYTKKVIKTERELLEEKIIGEQDIKFSIVIPLFNTPVVFLQELVDSIMKQTYSNWEICFSEGSVNNEELIHVLQTLEEDKRIKVIYNDEKLNISDNTNKALTSVEGEYVVFMDHDDVLAPNALYECYKMIKAQKCVDILYSDEDKISMDGTCYFSPHFKPDFSIDLLRSMNYFCHLVVVKSCLIKKIGGLRKEYDGAQDYDFVLRVVEKTKNIYHIPKVLYHWRAHKKSMAGNTDSKDYAIKAGKRALEAHYERLGIQAIVKESEIPGIYHTEYYINGTPKVSIIIPNKDNIDMLEKCLDSIAKKTTYCNYEILVVENNSESDETFEYYQKLEKRYEKAKVLYYEGGFNFSRINNYASSYANGEFYLFLNNDVEVISENWLQELLAYGTRSDTGVVGAKLYYLNDNIQHAGVIIGYRNAAAHAFINNYKTDVGYFGRSICAQNYSAVTAACMLVKKDVFKKVGGFDEELAVAYNDVDLCLKVREKGYLVTYNPKVELYHKESATRGLDISEKKKMRLEMERKLLEEKWQKYFRYGDPYYNPNLTLKETLFTLKTNDEY